MSLHRTQHDCFKYQSKTIKLIFLKTNVSQLAEASISLVSLSSNEITDNQVLTRHWPRSCSSRATWATVRSRCLSDKGTIPSSEGSFGVPVLMMD